MSNQSAKLPSAVYVFVVLSLAAFLALFSLWRRPHARYSVQVTAPVESLVDTPDEGAPRTVIESLQTRIAHPDSVLAGLKSAGMLSGNDAPRMRSIAHEVAQRMRASTITLRAKPHLQLTLLTEHPGVGQTLLRQIVMDHQMGESEAAPFSQGVTPIAKLVRGSSIPPVSLILLILCSGLVGVGGLVLLEHARETKVLLTDEDVMESVRLPVIMDFAKNVEFPAKTKHVVRRKRLSWATRAAELAIAGAVCLMAYNMMTHQPFSELMVNDPLAAYSEALGRLLG